MEILERPEHLPLTSLIFISVVFMFLFQIKLVKNDGIFFCLTYLMFYIPKLNWQINSIIYITKLDSAIKHRHKNK